jgi:hypothetical protein
MASIESIKKSLKPLLERTKDLSEDQMSEDKTHARLVLVSLREALPDHTEQQLAQVSYIIGLVSATMAELPVRELAQTLDNSAVGYAMATASILGLFDISEQKTEGSEVDFFGAYL